MGGFWLIVGIVSVGIRRGGGSPWTMSEGWVTKVDSITGRADG